MCVKEKGRSLKAVEGKRKSKEACLAWATAAHGSTRPVLPPSSRTMAIISSFSSCRATAAPARPPPRQRRKTARLAAKIIMLDRVAAALTTYADHANCIRLGPLHTYDTGLSIYIHISCTLRPAFAPVHIIIIIIIVVIIIITTIIVIYTRATS